MQVTFLLLHKDCHYELFTAKSKAKYSTKLEALKDLLDMALDCLTDIPEQKEDWELVATFKGKVEWQDDAEYLEHGI